MPTSAEVEVVQKSDAVLPLARRGTTVAGADVKNYIRAYYRDAAVLGRRATVLRLLGSGTTVGPRATTAQDVRYYRGGADVKNYIRPYYRTGAALGLGATVLRLQRSGTTVTHSGTTAGTCGTTASTAVAVRFRHN